MELVGSSDGLFAMQLNHHALPATHGGIDHLLPDRCLFIVAQSDTAN